MGKPILLLCLEKVVDRTMLPKVVVITPGSFSIPSAHSSSVERVVEQVIPLAKHRVHAWIFGRTSKKLPRQGSIQGVPCERFPVGGSGRYIRAIQQRLASLKPDIIQVENRPRYALYIKRRNPKAQVWLCLHSTTYISKSMIADTVLHRSLLAVDRILVNSDFLRTYLIARFKTIASKIVVNHLGVNAELFTPQLTHEGKRLRTEWLQQQGLHGRKVILYLGRLLPLKGVHRLLEVMPRVIRQEPKAMLLIVGSAFYGSNRKTAYVRKLERIAEPMKGYVQFVPYVPYHQVALWYSIADIVVVPSTEREAFGLVNVEAMASGIPVLATKAGGIQEIIEDGVTGFLLQPNDFQKELEAYLLRLLGNEELRIQMGVNGLKRVQQFFTWQHTADRWAKLVEREWDAVRNRTYEGPYSRC